MVPEHRNFEVFLLLAQIDWHIVEVKGRVAMPRSARTGTIRRPLPGDVLNVSRIEHETALNEIETNRRRFERNEQRITSLERAVAELKALVRMLSAERPR